MFDIIIEVIGITGLPGNCQKYTGIRSRTATYTLTVNVDDKIRLTYDFHKKDKGPKKLPEGGENDDKNSSYDLAKTFACQISNTSKLNFIVDCKHSQWNDPHNISTAVVHCKKLQFNSEMNVHIEYEEKSKLKTGTLTLKALRVSPSTELIQFKIPIRAKKPLYNASDLEGLGIVSQILKSEEGLSSLRSCPEWVNFLGSVGSLVKIAVPIAEIDPHAKLALSVAEVAFEIFIKQKERDERVLGLIQIIADVYQMILDSDPVMKCRTLSEAINNLIALTRECAYFIVQYIKPVPFVERTVINTLSSNDEIITQFEKHFFALKEVFFTGVMLSIAQMNVKILGKLEGIDSKLDHMFMLSFPLLGRSWSKLDGCIGGTQELLLSKIYEWGTSPSAKVPNIFLLLGTSKNSNGKTAVSHTVANYFFECGRLGATIFFDTKASSSSETFFLSIIRELSAYHPEIHERVMMGMKTSNVKLVNDPPDRQFHFLVSQVFKSLTLVGPTLIIIDGLDRCVERDILLKLLSKFPSNIRLLITSGPADDINAAFPVGSCIRHEMTSIEDDDMWGNLELYISGFLTVLEQLRPNLFQSRSHQNIAQEIYTKSSGINSLAQAILDFIATTEDEVAINFIELIFSVCRPGNEEEAREIIRSSLISISQVRDISSLGLIGKWAEGLDESVKKLVELQHTQLEDDRVSVRNYSVVTGIDVNALENLNSYCTMPTYCNFSKALEAVTAIDRIRDVPTLYNECVRNATHCLLTCKCSCPPNVLKEEYQSSVDYLLSNHWKSYKDKALPKANGESELPWALRCHHSSLQVYDGKCTFLEANPTTLVMLTPALQCSGSTTATDKITLLNIQFELVSNKPMDNIKFEAAIYRSTTEKGKTKLNEMCGTKPDIGKYINPDAGFLNQNEIHVVSEPLTGKTSWHIKTVMKKDPYHPGYKLFKDFADVHWYNCPVSSDGGTTQSNKLEVNQGRGFISCLQPGDHIAIIGQLSKEFLQFYTLEVTIYRDSCRDDL